MNETTSDPAQFLEALRPGGPWLLTAITPDGPIETRTLHDAASVRAFVDAHNGRRNLYYGVNPARTPLSTKAKKADIACAEYLHVDIDPIGEETPAAAKARALAALQAYERPPTAIIDTGGGIQALWKLEASADIDQAEARNKALIEHFRADRSTWNADRILRVPGTKNLPNKKKREKGRISCDARLLHFNGLRYPIEAFPAVAAASARTGPRESRAEVDLEDFNGSRYPVEAFRAAPASAGTAPRASLEELDLSSLEEGKAERLRHLIRDGEVDGLSFQSRSEAVFFVCCELIRADVPDAVILGVLLDRNNRISDHIHDRSDPAAYARRQVEQALKEQSRPGPILSAIDHAARARAFRAASRPNLRYWRGNYLDWKGGRYLVVEEDDITAEACKFLDLARTKAKDGGIRPFLPDRRSVGETMHMLRAEGHLDYETSPPSWLGVAGPAPVDLISFPNGLLNWRTSDFSARTPQLFTHHACRFPYDPKAPEPKLWLEFQGQIFEGEQEQIDLLQEMCGYLLTPDMSLQKIFLLIGPSRSGKGTIGRVLRSLLADGATCGPTVASFAGTFGLQPLIGRQLAIVDDLRLGKRTDKALITERLLTISGGGYLSVDRKYLPPWVGMLPTKFLILSNVVPAFEDDSGALASRFVTLSTRRSFLGREDRELDNKLRPELPGILLWALEGLRRLYDRGRFAESDLTRQMQARIAVSASPVQIFIEETCVYDPSGLIEKDALHAAFLEWSKRNDMLPMDKAHFCEAVIAAGNGRIRPSKPVVGHRQVPHLAGIRLRFTNRPEADDADWDLDLPF